MANKKISQLTGATTPLTGTEELAIVQGGQTVKATAQDVADLGGLPYLVYTARISQSGTDAPTVAVMQNTIGTVTWERSNTGIYNAISPAFNGFTSANKIAVFLTNSGSSYRVGAQYVPPISKVQVATLNTSNVNDDGILSGATIEIRVYP
jgi:hypothetical protein